MVSVCVSVPVKTMGILSLHMSCQSLHLTSLCVDCTVTCVYMQRCIYRAAAAYRIKSTPPARCTERDSRPGPPPPHHFAPPLLMVPSSRCCTATASGIRLDTPFDHCQLAAQPHLSRSQTHRLVPPAVTSSPPDGKKARSSTGDPWSKDMPAWPERTSHSFTVWS